MVKNLYHQSNIYTGYAIIQTVLSFALVSPVRRGPKNIDPYFSDCVDIKNFKGFRNVQKSIETSDDISVATLTYHILRGSEVLNPME